MDGGVKDERMHGGVPRWTSVGKTGRNQEGVDTLSGGVLFLSLYGIRAPMVHVFEAKKERKGKRTERKRK